MDNINEGSEFGNLELLDFKPRFDTVVSRCDSIILYLDVRDYRKTLMGYN